MKDILKEHLANLASQRESLVFAFSELNENLPHYSTKSMNLSAQISNIDIESRETINTLKEIKLAELANEKAENLK